MGMKKFEETKTMMVNTNKKSGFARHMKWALPVSAGFVAGVVPLGFGIYSIAHPKPSLLIIDRLRDFDQEIAEEFQQKDGSFLPNYEFIKYITVDEVVGEPINGAQDPANELYVEFKAKYPQYENVVKKGSFKFHVTRQDGTSYDISENSSTNGAIWNQGYSYKLLDLFNNDIPAFMSRITWENSLPAFNVNLDNAPVVPDWNDYKTRLRDEMSIQPTLQYPGVPDRTKLDNWLLQEPTPPSRGQVIAELTSAGTIQTLHMPIAPTSNANFYTMQDFEAHIASLQNDGVSDVQVPTNVNGYTLTFRRDVHSSDNVIVEYKDLHGQTLTSAEAQRSGLDVQHIGTTSLEEGYLAYLVVNQDPQIHTYYTEMVSYFDAKMENERKIEERQNELIDIYTEDYSAWMDEMNILMDEYEDAVAKNIEATNDFLDEQAEISQQRQAIRISNALVEQEFKDAMDHYINVELPEWERSLDAQSRAIVTAMRIQIEMARGDGGYVSPFEEDKFFYSDLIYSHTTGLFPDSLLTQQPRDIESIYATAVRSYMNTNNDFAIIDLLRRYISDDILPDNEITPSITIGQIPYFMGMFSGETVSFEYEVATTPNGVKIIPIESTGANRLNTTWLTGDDIIASYDIDKVNDLRSKERGGE